jgi:hypothetical protein
LKLHEQSAAAAAAGVFSSSVSTILMVGSFVDTSDGALHTKLWIDPGEELVEYSHTGAAVDVTFSVKELKAFMAFCEGAEADMHMYFDKAGV